MQITRVDLEPITMPRDDPKWRFARLLNDPAEGLEVEEGVLGVPAGVGVRLRTKD